MNRIDELLATAPIPALAGAFSAAGRSLFLVGGPVRDLLLGRRSTDLDFTTDAHPTEVKSLLRRAEADHIFAIGEKFGTIGGIFGEHVVEITTYRSEEYEPGSRKPKVEFGDSLEGDLEPPRLHDQRHRAGRLDGPTGGPVRRPGRPAGASDSGGRRTRGPVRRRSAAAAARGSAGGPACVRDRADHEARHRGLRRLAGDDQPRADSPGDGETAGQQAGRPRRPAADRPRADAPDRPRGAGDARHAPGRDATTTRTCSTTPSR